MTARFFIDEIVESSSVRVEKGRFCFTFTCPRCEAKQRASLSPTEAVQGAHDLRCANTKVCGEGNMTMDFQGIGTALLPVTLDDTDVLSLDVSQQGPRFVRVELTDKVSMDVCLQKVAWGDGRFHRPEAVPLNRKTG